MTVVNLCLVAMLGIINIEQAYAQLLTDLNNNKLIKDFLNNFPDATVEHNNENVLINANIDYLFPATGLLLTPPFPNDILNPISSTIKIAGKSFIGGSMEITVTENRTAARFGSNNRNRNALTGRIRSLSVNERIDFNAIDLIANLTLGPTGYTVDDMRILFVPVDNDLSYNITASDRDSGDRIKNWLSNKLPVVVDKYESYVDQLTNAGVLIPNDSLL